ncbi:glycosyltransferase family 4 protein [Roseateles sp. NT4]|uniref:glycosyltransferase family 4 protein n=1 Tax=Roseateles sp. NT4 TaxID=3453715 RepID=UPI003EED2E76
MKRLAALTQGANIPSSRFRIRQLLPAWQASGLDVQELVARPMAYPPPGLLARLAWAPQVLANTTRRVLQSNAFDAVIVQRELVSTLPTVEGLIRRPLIADVDDAIWLYRQGRAARNLARHADAVVAGNGFIADYFASLGASVHIIPTGVDTTRFRPLAAPAPRGYGVIGWSGTWGGYAYFEPLQQMLGALLRSHPDWKIRFVSDRPPQLPALPQAQVEYRPWSPTTEAELTADMDIGLMPLDDSPWSRGKCSYKMLLNMACGVPVVASAIGMNRDILAMADVGLGVQGANDWAPALEALMADAPRRQAMGQRGRSTVCEHFSLDAVCQRWLTVLQPFLS